MNFNPWPDIPLILLVGIAEFTLSWLNHRVNFWVNRRKRFEAARVDIIANILSEIIPYFVYVLAQQWFYLLPRIIANTLGTYKAATRKTIPAKNKYPKNLTTA